MNPITRIITYSLSRYPMLEENPYQKDIHKIQYDGNFKSHIVLPNQGMGHATNKVFMLEEVEARYVPIKEFLSVKGIKPSSTEELYLNSQNFIKSWTKPGNKLYFPSREVKLYLGHTVINGVTYYAIGYKKGNNYSMVLTNKVDHTESHDFWLV